jgi:hypothetical protein
MIYLTADPLNNGILSPITGRKYSFVSKFYNDTDIFTVTVF